MCLRATLGRECAAYPNDVERLALRDEVLRYPGVEAIAPATPATGAPVALVHLKRGDDEARLFSMLTTIGTPLDVTAQELTLEAYFPADDATDRWIRALAAASK